MSKLFDTLNKIQTNETYTPTPGGLQSPPRKKGNRIIVVLVVLAVTAVVVFLALQNMNTFKLPQIAEKQPASTPVAANQAISTSDRNDSPKQVYIQGVQGGPETITPVSDDILARMVQLNNQGVRLMARSDHWQGIYYFNKAHTLSPQSVEPIINMAVALMELGLTAPANRFFQEAITLDPNNGRLKDNLAMAARLGVLNDSLVQLVTGETAPL
jgi:tetratricopeptide (TPR) repeat protein